MDVLEKTILCDTYNVAEGNVSAVLESRDLDADISQAVAVFDKINCLLYSFLDSSTQTTYKLANLFNFLSMCFSLA